MIVLDLSAADSVQMEGLGPPFQGSTLAQWPA